MNVRQKYNLWSPTYDAVENQTRDLDKTVSQQVLRRYDFNTVLELGCGTGKNTKWLQTHCRSLIGVDFSDKMLGFAKNKIVDPRVRFIQADVTAPWDFTTAKFDLITSNLILEHILDIGFIFQQAALKLNNHGLFFLSEYHPYRQYLGKQARFEQDGETVLIDSFTHSISEFLDEGKAYGFELLELKEWMGLDKDEVPRILTLVFRLK